MTTSNEILEILSDLLAIPSPYPSGNTTEICNYTATRLNAAGYQTDTVSRDGRVQNVIAKMGTGKPSVVFNAHADTIAIADFNAWKTEPFIATEKEGRIHGLGAGNCKASMAIQIWLAEEIARRGGPKTGEVVFTFVGDEENLGPDGLAFLRESGAINPDVLICGAQTQLQTITEERGVLWIEISTTGISAHAGEPQNGDNAVDRMIRLIGKLDRELRPQLDKRSRGALRSTMNIGIIEGGKNTNAVPDQCRIEIDRRLMPEEGVDDAVAEFSETLKRSKEPQGSWTVRNLTGTKGFASPTNVPVIAAFQRAIELHTNAPPYEVVAVGASDARYFADDGIILMTFGPGNAKDGHKANEFVPFDELEPAARIQLTAIKETLGFVS